jgi:hypothetical protein
VRLAVARDMAGYTVLENLKGTYSIKGRTIYKYILPRNKKDIIIDLFAPSSLTCFYSII